MALHLVWPMTHHHQMFILRYLARDLNFTLQSFPVTSFLQCDTANIVPSSIYYNDERTWLIVNVNN